MNTISSMRSSYVNTLNFKSRTNLTNIVSNARSNVSMRSGQHKLGQKVVKTAAGIGIGAILTGAIASIISFFNSGKSYNELKVRLLSAETPVSFDVDYFKKWAEKNGFTKENGYSFSVNGAEGARWISVSDPEGNLIRRTTQDYRNPEKVYDDRIFYYENGEYKMGKVKYAWQAGTTLFSVSKSGTAERIYHRDLNGNWYNSETGKTLRKNPITGEKQKIL